MVCLWNGEACIQGRANFKCLHVSSYTVKRRFMIKLLMLLLLLLPLHLTSKILCHDNLWFCSLLYINPESFVNKKLKKKNTKLFRMKSVVLILSFTISKNSDELFLLAYYTFEFFTVVQFRVRKILEKYFHSYKEILLYCLLYIILLN